MHGGVFTLNVNLIDAKIKYQLPGLSPLLRADDGTGFSRVTGGKHLPIGPCNDPRG
jgi:hypothetical protein